MPSIEDRLRVILEPLEDAYHGCADGTLFRAVWSNVNPVDPTGVNEMWLNPELSTGRLPSSCPRCLVPKGLLKKCLDGGKYYDLPSHITIHQGEFEDEWCALALPSTCIVTEHAPDAESDHPCFTWELGDYAASLTECAETTARVTWAPHPDHPNQWYAHVWLRVYSCATAGDCQILTFLSGLLTLPEGGLDDENQITQVGVDYLTAQVTAGLPVTRTDGGSCQPTLTSLLLSLEICSHTGSLVDCCLGNGQVVAITACECDQANGAVVGTFEGDCECDPNWTPGGGWPGPCVGVPCCVDGIITMGAQCCDDTHEQACAAIGGVPTTLSPGVGFGEPCDEYTGGGGDNPCTESGMVTYQYVLGVWGYVSGTVPEGCCPVGPFPSSPSEGQFFETTLEPCGT